MCAEKSESFGLSKLSLEICDDSLVINFSWCIAFCERGITVTGFKERAESVFVGL